MLDDIDRARLLVSQRDGQISYAELGLQVGRLSGKAIGGIRRTHAIISLSTVKETREIDVSVAGSS
jgi:DNA-binding Lrp family transcriptional regulator